MKSLFLVAALAFTSQAEAVEIKISGATSGIKGVIMAHKDAVEKATGYTLKVTGNSNTQGLIDVAEGKSDIAINATSIDITIEGAKQEGKSYKASDFQLTQITTSELFFIVHPSNTVNSLSWAQLKDIFTGKITNWKAVGGADLPIVIFSDKLIGATALTVQKYVLKDEAYVSTMKFPEATRLIYDQVSEIKAGFAALANEFIPGNAVKTIKTDKLIRPVSLVTKATPSAEIKKVIAEYAKFYK